MLKIDKRRYLKDAQYKAWADAAVGAARARGHRAPKLVKADKVKRQEPDES